MNYKYFDKKLQKEIPVRLERWRWIVYFDDGTELMQFDPNTKEYHFFAEIKETGKKVTSFKMVSEDNPRGINLLIPEGADLIHYYRVQKLNVGTSNYLEVKFYIFGWKILFEGRSVKRLLRIYPDDFIEIMDDDNRENY